MTKISQLPIASTVDGTEYLPIVQGGITKRTRIQKLVDLIRPYKVYVALLTQEGSDAPVATVLENTTGETFTFGRDDIGLYFCAKDTNFVNAKTVVLTGQTNSEMQKLTNYFSETETSPKILFRTFMSINEGTAFDDRMYFTPIEIRIYP